MSARLQDGPGTDAMKLLLVGLSVLLCVVGLPCNCALLTAQLRLRYVSDVLLRSLALSDCLLLLATLLPLPQLLLPPRMLGDTVCGAHLALGYLAHVSGGLTLAALSVFRCLLLRTHWGHRGHRWAGWALCALIWSVSLLLAAPAGFLARALPGSALPSESDRCSRLGPAPVSTAAPAAGTRPDLPLLSQTETASIAELRSNTTSVSEPRPLAGFAPKPTAGPAPLALSAILSLPSCDLLFPASPWPWGGLWKWATLSAAYVFPLATMLACCCPLLVRLCSAGCRLPQSRCAAAAAAWWVLSSVATFSVCWTPLYVLVLTDPSPSYTVDSLRLLLVVLGTFSSAINPVVYARLDGRVHHHGDLRPAQTPQERESAV